MEAARARHRRTDDASGPAAGGRGSSGDKGDGGDGDDAHARAVRRLHAVLDLPPPSFAIPDLPPPSLAVPEPPVAVAPPVLEQPTPASADPLLPGGWVPDRPAGAALPRPAPTGLGAALRRAQAGLADRAPVPLRAMAAAPAGRALGALLVLVLVAVLASAVTSWVTRPTETTGPTRAELVGRAIAPSPGAPAATTGRAAVSAAGPATGSEASNAAVPSGSQVAAGDSGADGGAPAPLIVHVVGAVRRPGVVQLAAGARVADAVAAAGGVTARGDPASVNLARPLVDGEQLVVARLGQHVTAPAGPVLGGAASGSASSGSSSGSSTTNGPGASASTPVDLNAATLEQLDTLPGIGPVLAQRILDWRTENGRFSTVEELGEVSGIGEATLSDLRPLVMV